MALIKAGSTTGNYMKEVSKTIEKRIEDLEKSKSNFTKVVGGLGITAAVIISFLEYIQATSFEVVEKLHNAKNTSIETIEKASYNETKKISSISKNLLNGVCRAPIKRNGSCSYNDTLSCPTNTFMKSIETKGGTNSCVRSITCCSLNFPWFLAYDAFILKNFQVKTTNLFSKT